uniref:Uncharacterized protein n=1 Tax=Parascaris equorum TaxID=6256 RepID=A0A914R2M2_PAREQ
MLSHFVNLFSSLLTPLHFTLLPVQRIKAAVSAVVLQLHESLSGASIHVHITPLQATARIH